jgi:hypothetical protein
MRRTRQGLLMVACFRILSCPPYLPKTKKNNYFDCLLSRLPRVKPAPCVHLHSFSCRLGSWATGAVVPRWQWFQPASLAGGLGGGLTGAHCQLVATALGSPGPSRHVCDPCDACLSSRGCLDPCMGLVSLLLLSVLFSCPTSPLRWFTLSCLGYRAMPDDRLSTPALALLPLLAFLLCLGLPSFALAF